MNTFKPVIIGIAGGSGSGKTTFAKKLVAKMHDFKTVIVSTDSFFKKPLPKITSPVSGKIYDDWNAPNSIDLNKLLNKIEILCSEESDYDLIIVEGISTLYFQELLELFHLKIFIDLDSDERMYRRIKRNMKMWGVSLEEVAEYYLDAAKYAEQHNFLDTKKKADVIINGNSDFERPVELISAWIREKMETKESDGNNNSI